MNLPNIISSAQENARLCGAVSVRGHRELFDWLIQSAPFHECIEEGRDFCSLRDRAMKPQATPAQIEQARVMPAAKIAKRIFQSRQLPIFKD